MSTSMPPLRAAKAPTHDGDCDGSGDSITRSELHRLDIRLGGGTGADPRSTKPGALVAQAERTAGRPLTFVIGVELGGTEHWLRLDTGETRLFTAQLTHLLRFAEPTAASDG